MQDTFESGYTKALLDMQNLSIVWLHSGNKISSKDVTSFLDCAIKHRAELRELGCIPGLVWNKQQRFFVKGEK